MLQITKALALNDLPAPYPDKTGWPWTEQSEPIGDHIKSVAYSAADLFIFPTRVDNLPLVLQESMACGTPMVDGLGSNQHPS